MLQFDPSCIETLRTLRRVLDRYDYDVVMRTLRGLYYFHDPWLGEEVYRFYHETLPLREEVKTLFTLFVFGGKKEAHKVKRALGKNLTSELLAMGFLREDDGDILSNQYLIVSLNGQYFIVTYPNIANPNPKRGFSVYMGQDSYKLVHHLDRSRRGIRGLDLCSGSGIIGQVMAPWAQQVVGVEMSPEAINVSRANAILNGVENNWEVRDGDLWTPVKGETFDLIISNPPFVAVPKSFEFPIFGSGGEDGLLFIRRILEDCESYLNPGGRVQMVFEGLGTPDQAIVEPLLQDFMVAHPTWSAKLLLYARVFLWEKPMEPFGEAAAHSIGKTDKQTERQLTLKALEAMHRQGFEYIYKELLFIDSQPFDQPGLQVLRLYNPWERKSTPQLKWPVQFKEMPNHLMSSSQGISLRMNPIQRDLTEQFDGQTSLEEAAYKIWQLRGGLLAGIDPASYLDHALELCRILHQLDFVDKPTNSHWQHILDTHNPFASQEKTMDGAMNAMEKLFALLANVQNNPDTK